MNRTTFLSVMLAGFVTWLTFGEIPRGTTGSQGMLESRAVLALLDEFLDMPPFQGELSLKEFLVTVMEKFAAKGKELPIFVDKDSFKKSDRDFDIYDVQVRFLPYPKRMRVIEALRIALSQSEKPASFLIRRGMMVIIPKNEASA